MHSLRSEELTEFPQRAFLYLRRRATRSELNKADEVSYLINLSVRDDEAKFINTDLFRINVGTNNQLLPDFE